MRSLLPAKLALIATAALVPACTDEPEQELGVTCDGKCDGIGSLRSLIRDAKKLDLGDLVAIGAKFATDGINDALKITDYASIKLDEPRFFALPGVASADLTLENIDELVSGLAARYGERELSTEVNAVRRAHLMASDDKVFVESAFTLGANVNPSWGDSVGGLGTTASVWVGFDAGLSLQARVIGAYKGELTGVARAPLKAISDTRGFVFPRSLAEIKAMKPGESFALQGQGHLGANLGVGVPILVANPTSVLTYSLILSAGLRARLGGQLDVQLVRLDGDQVVVDVGMQKAREWSASLAIDDAWGVQGLLETHISLAGIDLDLGKLVDKALQKELNAKLNLFSVMASQGTQASRVSVARLRFRLDAGDPAVIAPAIAQALRGDVRLAQALANRKEPGVIAEFDLLRSGSTTTSYAGVDILGMSFFKKTIASEGGVVIQTPGGAMSLLFQSLHKQSGSFFSDHGYTRVGLAGLSFDPDKPGEARGEANLIVQLQDNDQYMERDKMLDHVDALILAIGGARALADIEKPGNQLQRYVEAACPNSGAYDPCRENVLSDPMVIQLRQAGVAAANNNVTGLSDGLRAMLVKLAEFRMTTQATYEPHAALVGPNATFTVDFRLDNGTLNQLMTERDATSYKEMLKSLVDAVGIDRMDTDAKIASARASLESSLASKIDAMGKQFAEAQTTYKKLLGVEKAAIDTVGTVGPRTLEIRVPVDASNRPLYENAVAHSLAEAREQVVTALFDALAKNASGFPTHVEEIAAYPLLGMADAAHTDVRLDAKMDLTDNLSQSYSQYRLAGYAPFDISGKGEKCAPIDGGMFSIDSLLQGQ
ncbi:MAG TPA: hypothetical protein VLB44_27350 [Kofleriaceae bacterium]|nr:hypothetical protein [Kofleriaceae bacterium]